jgi:hypothetical protein
MKRKTCNKGQDARQGKRKAKLFHDCILARKIWAARVDNSMRDEDTPRNSVSERTLLYKFGFIECPLEKY